MKVHLALFFLLLCAVNGVSDQINKKREDVNLDIGVSLMKVSNEALAIWLNMGIAVHEVQQSIQAFSQSVSAQQTSGQFLAVIALCLASISYIVHKKQINKLKADVCFYENQMDRYYSDIKKSDAYYRGRIAVAEKRANEQYLSARRAEIFQIKAQNKLQNFESYVSKRFGIKKTKPCPKFCMRLLPPRHLPPLKKNSQDPPLYIIRV